MADDSKAPYFDPKSVPLNARYRDIGRSAERPFMIFATLLVLELGDLVSKVVFLSTLKEQFDHARLIVRYRALRSYSAEVVALSPNIDHATPLPGERPKWLGRRLPDMRPWLPLGRGTLGREGKREAFYDLVVTESMMPVQSVHTFERPAILRIPPEREDGLRRRLIGLGLDPGRWYATLHYRAGNYEPTRNRSPIRNSDPESYRQLADFIIDGLGGQVVQLGHPEMRAFPPRPGFVDLSRLENSFLLQAYAVSHSRFLVAGPSGPVALGWGFQVPTAVVDATDGHGGWGDAEQVILTHEVTTPDDRVLMNRALLEAGLLDKDLLARKIQAGENYRVRKNSAQELAAAARFLFERTTDTEGWRPALRRPSAARPNRFVWPPQTHDNLRFLGE
ncbi:MAG: TIGR04372 family glycosyltransferase [Pseudomonadota bacterium]